MTRFWWWYSAGLLSYLALFLWLPSIDTTISSWFYVPDDGFPLRYHPLPVAIYTAVKIMTWGASIVLVMGTLLASIQRYLPQAWRKFLVFRTWLFLLLALALGPGAVVHWVVKEAFGRPRPVNIEQFGGDRQFVPAFHLSPLEDKSFTSGHASMGFYVLTFALLLEGRKRIWMYRSGIVLGLFFGGMRVLQGGHFISDIIGSAFIVIAVSHGLHALLWRKQWSG